MFIFEPQCHTLVTFKLNLPISENGGKTLMQASEHYYTTQISIFLTA